MICLDRLGTEVCQTHQKRGRFAQLAAFDPPNVGAVGPTCRQGNTGAETSFPRHFMLNSEYFPRQALYKQRKS